MSSKNALSFTPNAKDREIYVLFFNRNECNSKTMYDEVIEIASFPTIMIIVTEIEDKVTYLAVNLTLFL